MKKILVKISIVFFHCAAHSFDIDKAFEAQNKVALPDTSVTSEATRTINNASNSAQDKINELNKKFYDEVREASRRAEHNASYEKRSASDWTIISEEKGGGLAHWYQRKIWIRCNFGRKANESFSIHLLNSGKWSTTYCGGGFDSFADAAQSCCRSSSY